MTEMVPQHQNFSDIQNPGPDFHVVPRPDETRQDIQVKGPHWEDYGQHVMGEPKNEIPGNVVDLDDPFQNPPETVLHYYNGSGTEAGAHGPMTEAEHNRNLEAAKVNAKWEGIVARAFQEHGMNPVERLMHRARGRAAVIGAGVEIAGRRVRGELSYARSAGARVVRMAVDPAYREQERHLQSLPYPERLDESIRLSFQQDDGQRRRSRTNQRAA